MSQNRLPPLNLNSPKSASSQSSIDGSVVLSARERRRKRLSKQIQDQTNDQAKDNEKEETEPVSLKPARSASAKKLKDEGHENSVFESEENLKSELNTSIATTATVTKPGQRARRSRRNNTQTGTGDDGKPPTQPKKPKKNQTGFLYNSRILEGLEEDVIEMDEENKDSNRSEKNLSERELLGNESSDNIAKSVPTDKFYLELEKKFEIRNKQLFEKREQERLRTLFDAQLKQKQKEELKYQISTPKTALMTHKFLKVIFLFFHGVNVGFQIWQTIIIYFLNLTQSKINYAYSEQQGSNVASFSLFLLFENLTMPIHCLSYFFLAICIVDTMDRVDLTKLNLKYLVKCLSFQNQFWSIIFYAIALIVSLSIIYIDESVYLTLFLENLDVFNKTNETAFLNNINTNVDVWKSLNIVKAVFSILAWLLFSICIRNDQTYDSLEKRDFSLLDDIAISDVGKNNNNQNNQSDPTLKI